MGIDDLGFALVTQAIIRPTLLTCLAAMQGSQAKAKPLHLTGLNPCGLIQSTQAIELVCKVP